VSAPVGPLCADGVVVGVVATGAGLVAAAVALGTGVGGTELELELELEAEQPVASIVSRMAAGKNARVREVISDHQALARAESCL